MDDDTRRTRNQKREANSQQTKPIRLSTATKSDAAQTSSKNPSGRVLKIGEVAAQPSSVARPPSTSGRGIVLKTLTQEERDVRARYLAEANRNAATRPAPLPSSVARPPSRSGRGIVLKTLTEEEKEARARQLVEANKEAERARQAAAEEAKRRLETSTPQRIVVTKRIYVRDRRLALHQIRVLLTAFEEVAEFNPRLGHNQPPPALWIDDADSLKDYLKDVKELVAELKQLNEHLKKSPEISAPKPAETVSAIKSAGNKFLGSYAEALGKGAAALSIMAVAALLVNLGVGKEIIDPILTKLGK